MAQDDTAVSRALDWSEDQIRRKGLLKVAALPVAALGILTTVGIIVDVQALKWGAVAGVGFALVLWNIAINLDRRHLRKLTRARGQALSIYGKRLTEEIDATRFEVLRWKERITVTKRGKGVIRRWITIRVSDNAPLEAFWSVQTTHSERMNESVQARVVFVACASDPSGAIGPSHLTTLDWETSMACKAFVHLERPLPPGSVAYFYMEWRWPHHFSSLLAGKTEPFNWTIRRPVRDLDVCVTVRGTATRQLIKVSSLPSGPTAMFKSRGSKHVIALKVTDLREGSSVAFDAQLHNGA